MANTRHSIATICASVRLIALSILFAGSSAIVFAAVTFVRTARLAGMSTSYAASFNAPTFIAFSKVALAAAVVLVVTEIVEYFFVLAAASRLRAIRYGLDAGCFASALMFATAIVPAMEKLMPLMKDNAAAYAAFQNLHHWSQIYFSGIILCALLSLLTLAPKQE